MSAGAQAEQQSEEDAGDQHVVMMLERGWSASGKDDAHRWEPRSGGVGSDVFDG